MMMQTMTQQPQPFDAPEDGMFSGWTDEDIDAYSRWCEDEARYAVVPRAFFPEDETEPPF